MAVPRVDGGDSKRYCTFGITDVCAQTLLNMTCAKDFGKCHSQDDTLQDVLNKWVVKHALQLQTLPTAVVTVAWPLAPLVCSSFDSLMLPALCLFSQSSAISCFLGQLYALWRVDDDGEDPLTPRSSAKEILRKSSRLHAVEQMQDQQENQEGVNYLNGSMLEGLSNYIRRLMGNVVAVTDPEMQSDGLAWLEFLTRLRECHSAKDMMNFAWRPLAMDSITRGGALKNGVRGRFSPAYLLNCMKISMNTLLRKDDEFWLKNDSDADGSDETIVKHLKASLCRHAQLFPPNVRAELIDEIHALPVPSVAAKYKLDVAALKHQCHVHKLMFNEGVSLFGFADASQLKMANVEEQRPLI